MIDRTSIAGPHLWVDIETQTLGVYEIKQLIRCYGISTAKNGVGERFGSEKTPRGWHEIRAKIGDQAPIQSVFIARRLTGEIYTEILAAQEPDRDWILTRILWLSGLEKGFNRLGDCDTMRRMIYIHGTPDDRVFGTPQSRGCIQMHNADIIELFAIVKNGTKIFIKG